MGDNIAHVHGDSYIVDKGLNVITIMVLADSLITVAVNPIKHEWNSLNNERDTLMSVMSQIAKFTGPK